MNLSRVVRILLLSMALLAMSAATQGASPREELKQMVEQLQKTPTDNALREKIIKLVQEVKPAPAVPPEAKRAFIMGGTYQKVAKSPEDFALAVKAFQEATSAAPWWGDAYYNLSVALESAKRYDEAKGALTLYLLTNPKDAEQAQERLYAIDAKQQSEAIHTAIAIAIAAEKRKNNSIEGYWYCDGHDSCDAIPLFRIERIGDALVVKPVVGNGSFSEVQITETSVSMTFHPPILRILPRFILHLRDGALVGTVTTHVTGAYRLIRKPWDDPIDIDCVFCAKRKLSGGK